MGSDALEDYILAHTEPEPDYLYRLWRATNIHTIHGRMASGQTAEDAGPDDTA